MNASTIYGEIAPFFVTGQSIILFPGRIYSGQADVWAKSLVDDQYSAMAFVSNYVAPPGIPENELYGPEPYDLNFVFPIPPQLSTHKLRLVPFIPRVHVAAYLDSIRGHESIFEHILIPLEHPADFPRLIETWRRDQNAVAFAAIDTTRPDPDHPEWEGALAGVFGLLETDKTMLTTEIGPAIVLPAFQRTHVGSHAVGLLLKYILELAPLGLGLRKVEWTASPMNTASNDLAKRMGFRLEGLMRWMFVMPDVEGYQRLGKEGRAGDAGNGLLGSDGNMWAMCSDDWEGGGRELVERAFARVA